jgi:hypothetical protein
VASVIDAVACKQCGYRAAILHFRTRGEEWSVFCPRCGGRWWVTACLDRAGSVAGERARRFKLARNGRLVRRHYQRPGHGAYRLATVGGAETLGAFGGPATAEETGPLVRLIGERSRDGIPVERRLDPARCQVTRWTGERVEWLYGGPLPNDPDYPAGADAGREGGR